MGARDKQQLPARVGWRLAGLSHVLAASAAVLCLAAMLLCGCDEGKPQPSAGSVSAGPIEPNKVPAELAARVLAQVGGRTITLGDYAAALERMDQFERLRYQTPERRKQLLDELINAELLAREAEKRG